ncbi:Positive regulator of CheA protein activity [Citrifermentans bremense]|jgi:purine-binding chemotaxis protein CheW|uniref:Chemotaxis protein CheW n=2 Tax=Geobacteraceae TaxID=213422 RepID=A0ABQ0MMY5_9BACT|nr:MULTISPECIES: chemotaxis protein CheW [Geobacteraceae]BCG49076.1 Positive regulator of CheA protein activity [Citrifermentans bremense]GAW68441.1 chemotaxis protein CheW [Geoanaerobacter pelophilus]
METALTKVKSEEYGGELIQLVSFNLEKEEYGINVLMVREIIRMLNITRVPNTPHYVEGVINLRGKVIPIINLRKKFDLMDSEYDKRTRIMVMEVVGELMGFIVDEVSEVIRISEKEIQPPPPAVSSGIEQECMAGVINQADRLLVLLDLERMFSADERRLFSNVG